MIVDEAADATGKARLRTRRLDLEVAMTRRAVCIVEGRHAIVAAMLGVTLGARRRGCLALLVDLSLLALPSVAVGAQGRIRPAPGGVAGHAADIGMRQAHPARLEGGGLAQRRQRQRHRSRAQR